MSTTIPPEEKSVSQTALQGIRVLGFESRRCEDMTRMLQRAGAETFVSPSMQEVALDEDQEAVNFAEQVIAGKFDVVVFLTGVGIRHWMQATAETIEQAELLEALQKTTIVARGPKPVSALRELKIRPDYRIPEPNTWREIVDTLSKEIPLANKRVAVQEYGRSNPNLLAGLEALGASVQSFRVYRWELPDDLGPLEANLQRIARQEADVLLFTSSPQVVHFLQVAQRMGIESEVRQGLENAVVLSIGPTTTERLHELKLPMDGEPEHPKMGYLVNLAIEAGPDMVQRKRAGQPTIIAKSSPVEVPSGEPSDALQDSLFMKACRLEPTPRPPIWLMRQAGRYMKEYRAVREGLTFLELCKNPDLCTEVMLTAVDRLGVDAAILFADLLPILEAMGFDLEYVKGDGPVIHNPLRKVEDLSRVQELEDADSQDFVLETVRKTRAGLPSDIPLIGFAGAPFTLASYAIEGGGSRNYLNTKRFMFQNESAWHDLLGRLARSVAIYLNAQIEAGAQAVQLFDSWVGCLNIDDYRRYVLPHTRSVIQAITPGTPVIHFGAGNPTLLPALREAGGDVLGIDWRTRLEEAWKLVGYDRAVQGNLDPLSLLAPMEVILQRTDDLLKQAAGRPGHIFNLGHGIVPQTPVEHVIELVSYIKGISTESS
ncbi:Uroporphyrinogen decarboxylase [Planctomycetales bacterium 10988]|nr:Uroporphyrinogen decarboxylase [Planctomycetales bacterium 10988]